MIVSRYYTSPDCTVIRFPFNNVLKPEQYRNFLFYSTPEQSPYHYILWGEGR